MIKKLIIQNFRSIEDLEVELEALSGLIGPNSAGKSNILEALDLIVGTTYPSIRSFDDSDFYLHDDSRTIHIEVRFQEPVSYKSYDIDGFCLTYNGNECSYLAIDDNGEILTYYSGGNEIRVNNQMRNQCSMMYLPLDRQAYQQITPSQWKVYGKLLKHIASQIRDNDRDQFKTNVEDAFDQYVFNYVRKVEDLLKNYVKEQSGLEISLKLSLIDPTMILRDLRPRITSSTGFEVDIKAEGAGVQSAVAIAIARTYAEIVGQPLILGIEEPELYLHPHGCRHFYKILKDLSLSGVQVIYTTHERSFVNIADFKSVFLVKKENEGTTVYTGKDDISDFDTIKTASKFDEEINEVFFADKVILVEGPDDKIACKLALVHLGVELDKHNISIVDCGGNTGIKPMAEILLKFNIETFALLDEDPGNPNTQETIDEIRQLIGNKVFLQSPDLEGIFGQQQKFTKEKALSTLPQWLNSNQIPQVYTDLQSSLGV